MSGMDYFEGAPSGGYQTAGWFLLGMPFLLGFSFLVSVAITFMARRMGAAVTWSLAVVVFGVLIYQSVIISLPKNRLAAVVNVDLQNAKICRLKQMDSYCDGVTTIALIDGDTNLFDQICLANELRESSTCTPTFFNWLHDNETPFLKPVPLFENEYLTCYNDRVNRKLYIYHRSRAYPTEN